ncbi:response regulator [Flavobacterium sp. MK4S-17]|uniref:response regulator n=1 Tax=Flavobacterium sp. MK4S-17 TaxID=2543737 RepID=UPI001358C519|nr:response regulator [Flavobacterium sp. MK4S-17]
MKEQFTIFYTDDDQDDLAFFQEIIELIGEDYNVVTQNNGSQLLYDLNNPPPNPYMIFLDINMPGMNGFDTLKKVRESNNHKTLPVVIFSTSSDETTIEKSRELGASFYLPKSGIFDQLKKAIEHTLAINWSGFIPAKNNFVYNYL